MGPVFKKRIRSLGNTGVAQLLVQWVLAKCPGCSQREETEAEHGHMVCQGVGVGG